ncbi:MAG TPA: hypothetical protein VLC46_23185 [Thermoanaerobaculia bacterium]|jgi:hypothetical protein|nr:hypothetical protein [Thermoanaerobaculia bacterium]
MKRKTILAAIAASMCIGVTAFAQTNVLVNGDFESSPPSACLNNIGWSISPWVLGTGSQANVVTVDGNVACLYGSNGPQFDASIPQTPAGTKQHYLDIDQGQNFFYQTFTPQCSGQVVFGGSFSTRANSSGTGSVTLMTGAGTSGTIVAQKSINLPGGNSQTDPWTPVSATAFITASNPYSFVVQMDDNMNFDNGFVKYQMTCTPPDPCCPPWNSTQLEDMLVYQGSGGIAAPYTLVFTPTNTFKTQIQAYIDYLHAVNSSINEIILELWLNDEGAGANPVPTSVFYGTVYFIGWFNGAFGVPHGSPPPFFTLATESMQVNNWYRVNSFMYLNNSIPFFPDSCASNVIDVRIQVQAKGLGQKRVLQIRRPDGHIVEKELSLVKE